MKLTAKLAYSQLITNKGRTIWTLHGGSIVEAIRKEAV